MRLANGLPTLDDECVILGDNISGEGSAFGDALSSQEDALSSNMNECNKLSKMQLLSMKIKENKTKCQRQRSTKLLAKRQLEARGYAED